MEKNTLKTYLMRGMTYIVVFIVCILFAFILFNIGWFKDGITLVMKVLKPVIFGLIIAYIIHPIVDFWERKMLNFTVFKTAKNKKRAAGAARGLSIFCSMLLAAIIVIVLMALVLPQLINSVISIMGQIPGFVDDMTTHLTTLRNSETQAGYAVTEMVNRGAAYLEQWLQSDIYPQLRNMLTGVTASVVGIFSFFYNILIGAIIAIYLLASKEKFVGQSKKMVYAIFKPSVANALLDIARQSNHIFGGFISGKIIDSLIIGVLCFIGVSILHTPYGMLVSVIVGVTNVIPFFGPYIGAIPSTIIILMVSPKMAVFFLIFVLILQQIDGNIIGPKILGESTGLSAFWVVFSILLGGGLFGFVGMLMGVPTFAVIYHLIKTLIEYFLDRKQMPIASEVYQNVEGYDDISGKLIYFCDTEAESVEEENKENR